MLVHFVHSNCFSLSLSLFLYFQFSDKHQDDYHEFVVCRRHKRKPKTEK